MYILLQCTESILKAHKLKLNYIKLLFCFKFSSAFSSKPTLGVSVNKRYAICNLIIFIAFVFGDMDLKKKINKDKILRRHELLQYTRDDHLMLINLDQSLCYLPCPKY